MERMLRLRAWLDGHRDVVVDAVRIYVGLFLFAKGVWFATHAGAISDLLTGSHWQQAGAAFIDSYVALAHLAGGLMLTAGLITRAAAAVQLPVLVGALFLVHRNEPVFGPTSSLQLELLVLFLLVALVVHGGGRFSVDAWLTKSFEAHRPHQAQ